LLISVHLHAGEPERLELADSKVGLSAQEGWAIKKQDGETSIFPPDQPAKGSPSRIHLVWPRTEEKTLEQALEAEIASITKRWPGSGNSREHFKGSVPVVTVSGMQGLRADFYFEQTINGVSTKYYEILKYYFRNDDGRVFKVCVHVYGDEKKLEKIEAFILNNLTPTANN